MNCIEIDPDSVESPAFHDVRIMRAKRDYRCCECGQIILSGERYERAVGKWDGEIDTFRTCLPCSRIRKDFFCTYSYTQMWEDLVEELGEEVTPWYGAPE